MLYETDICDWPRLALINLDYTRKNAQVVTNLRANCNKSAIKPLQDVFVLSHCLFPVVATSYRQVINVLVTRLINTADLLQVCPTSLMSSGRNKLLRACCQSSC